MQIILIRRVLLTNRKLTENTRLDSNLVFTRDLRSPRILKDVSDAYHSSFPYKHCVLEGWISDNVLRNVRHEILENLVFFEKETDIYKVFCMIEYFLCHFI